MVALNTDFAASKPATDAKNRVGRFFSLAAESAGKDSRSSLKYAGEKRNCRYDFVSVDTAFEYGAFGELIRATGEKKEDFNFRFSTKYEDTETGLLYYGYRYYNAETGRWSNRDPIEEEGGLNLYVMVGNDPVNFFDYLGLETKTKRVPFLFISYFTESCVPIASISPQAPGKLWSYISTLVTTASFIEGLIGNVYRTDTFEDIVPDCYVLERNADGSAREEVNYELLNWRISDGGSAFQVAVCGKVKETIEWVWIPDPDDECCK